MIVKIALLLLLAGTFTPVFGQSLADIALYEGADRHQRLVAAAKKEGALLLYTTIAATTMEKIAADFARKYGVKVNSWRAGTNKVLQRVLTETKANRFDADAIHFGSPEMEILHQEKLLQEIRSPYFKDLIPNAVPPHKEWAATYVNLFVQAYNTDKVKKDELPKTYQDLLDPKWKGRLGIESQDQEWFYAVVTDMGEGKGLKFFRHLVATNGLSVRTGHSVLTNLVVSGEVPLALTVHHYLPEQLKHKGAPIDWFAIEPAIGRANAIAVTKKAPHPHAAVLFYEYMISDGQKLLAEMDYVPTNKKIPSPVKNLQIKLLDPSIVASENDKWTKLYEDTIHGVQ
ncbi:MAG TPA: extracellular solute-binding protein [Acidiferrobacterales bacterium]|nr:extracellular solute-binding protein [Acidiferrobacterales bacterium]